MSETKVAHARGIPVELFVFRGEGPIGPEFLEVTIGHHTGPRTGTRETIWLSWPEPARFAIRVSDLNRETQRPVNPYSVACPCCKAEPWDPCVESIGLSRDVLPKAHNMRRSAAECT